MIEAIHPGQPEVFRVVIMVRTPWMHRPLHKDTRLVWGCHGVSEAKAKRKQSLRKDKKNTHLDDVLLDSMVQVSLWGLDEVL